MDWWVIIGSIAAVVAAIFAILTWIEAKRSQRTADDRYERDTAPRVRVVDLAIAGGATSTINKHKLKAMAVNAGGTVTASVIIVQFGNGVFVGGGAIPNHGSRPVQFRFRAIREPDTQTDPANALIVLAKDVNGSWWDCNRGAQISSTVGEFWQSELARLAIPRMAFTESDDDVAVTIGPAGQP